MYSSLMRSLSKAGKEFQVAARIIVDMKNAPSTYMSTVCHETTNCGTSSSGCHPGIQSGGASRTPTLSGHGLLTFNAAIPHDSVSRFSSLMTPTCDAAQGRTQGWRVTPATLWRSLAHFQSQRNEEQNV